MANVRGRVRKFGHAGQLVRRNSPIFPKPAREAFQGHKVVIRRRDALALRPNIVKETDNGRWLKVSRADETAGVQAGLNPGIRQVHVRKDVPLGNHVRAEIGQMFGQRCLGVNVRCIDDARVNANPAAF
ncbi:MAG TPA: hypothetical protein VK395_23590 [Gemmataceae bacterium]|nr:hypothetical protein [Gemmataceae bacterium]